MILSDLKEGISNARRDAFAIEKNVETIPLRVRSEGLKGLFPVENEKKVYCENVVCIVVQLQTTNTIHTTKTCGGCFYVLSNFN